MSIGLEDTVLSGYRSRDLVRQTAVDSETLFAVHPGSWAYKIDYGSLSSDIKERALKLMRVKSMAYAETWQYSPIDHDHDIYTNIQIYPKYGEDDP